MKQPHIYIMTNIKNTTLYIGVTSQLVQRVYQHKSKLTLGFTNKYNLNKLVYFESFETMYDAITREKQLKNWRRAWKKNLI
jgi:putative endonuclease